MWRRCAPSRFDPAFRAAWLALRPWNRHSLVLSIFGGIFAAIGTVWAFQPVTRTREQQWVWFLHWTDGAVAPWGLLWILVGVLTIVSTRWPPRYDRWGYVAMGGLVAFWSTGTLAGAIFYDTPWLTALGGALVWAGFSFALWAIAGLTAPIVRPHDGDL